MLCATTFLGLALLVGKSAAICTEWDHDISEMESGYTGFTMSHGIDIDSLPCPPDSATDCPFPEKVYDITVERRIFTSKGDPVQLPANEADAIFDLATKGSTLKRGNSSRPFVTLSGTLDTTGKDLEARPGKNSTLTRIYYLMSEHGVVGGCSIDTMNGMDLTVEAPYEELDENNNTIIAGTWVIGHGDYDDESGVESLFASPLQAIWVWLLVSMLTVVIL